MYLDRLIQTNPHWIRDYMLTLKGFKYTENDVTSFPDLILENQNTLRPTYTHLKGFDYYYGQE